VGAESRGRRGMFPPVLEFRLRMMLPRRRNLSPSRWGVSRMFSSVGELAPKRDECESTYLLFCNLCSCGKMMNEEKAK